MLELNKVFKRIDSKIMLALSLWPMMLAILSYIFPDVFQIQAQSLIGAYDFLAEMVILQDLIFLPVLITVFSASLSFNEEFRHKQIYIYKDKDRTSVLNNKYFSVYSLYFIYLILYSIVAIIAYYLIFRHFPVASGTFFTTREHILPQLYELIQVVIAIIFYINIGIFFSMRFSTGVSIFGVTLIYMFLKIASSLGRFAYFFPTGYREMEISNLEDFIRLVVLSLVVGAIYNIGLYIINKRKFAQMEFR